MILSINSLHVLGFILILTVIVLFSINLYIRKKEPKSQSRPNADLAFIEELKEALGKDNLLGVTYEHERIKFSVKDIKQSNLIRLKSLSTKGIFVQGKTITMTFSVDPKTILDTFKGDK